MGNSGMITGGAGGQEITLTINNSSLTQAFASASCANGAAANPQEITLTISGVYMLYKRRSHLEGSCVCKFSQFCFVFLCVFVSVQ